MFVKFGLNAFESGRPQRDFASLFTTAQCIMFSVQKFSHSPTQTCNEVQKDKLDVCPECDDNGEAPIGCFVSKDALMDMGVIHQ
jgi:hypothetical protein